MKDFSVVEAEFGDLSRWKKSPDFWPALPEEGMAFIRRLRSAAVRTIGRSAGGREIIAIEYGQKEPLDAQTDNLHSAIACSIVPPDPTAIFPEAFYGKNRRIKPVVVFQGAIHGSELTGTVASLNLCQILETGADLRGKKWPRLLELARETRICIIPWLNIDGASRAPTGHFSGMPLAATSRINMGVALDGTKYAYPAVKGIFPIPPEKTAFMGTYFNDAGVNLQYDFCMPQRQPETLAWMEYYLSERPDGVVIWHCNAGSLIGPPDFYLPVGCQLEETRLAGAVRARLKREGYSLGRMSWAVLPGLGKPIMTQVAAVYHVCGATPVMCELPTGFQEQFYSCEEMLDIALIVIEEILFYAHTDGLRPYEVWEKVRPKRDASEAGKQKGTG